MILSFTYYKRELSPSNEKLLKNRRASPSRVCANICICKSAHEKVYTFPLRSAVSNLSIFLSVKLYFHRCYDGDRSEKAQRRGRMIGGEPASSL